MAEMCSPLLFRNFDLIRKKKPLKMIYQKFYGIHVCKIDICLYELHVCINKNLYVAYVHVCM